MNLSVLRAWAFKANSKFSFWLALDMHTADGKQTLKDVVAELGVPQRQILWCSFYFESAKPN